MSNKSTATINLEVIQQSNYFISYAKRTVANDIKQTKKLTFDTITAITSLAVSFYVANNSKSELNIINLSDNTINYKKLRGRILDSIFNVQQLEELQSSAGRVIYNKIKAGLLIFEFNLSKLCKLWKNYKSQENGESLFIQEVYQIVESYQSLTKILALGKNESIHKKSEDEQKTTDSDSESSDTESSDTESLESDTESESTKSLYNKVSTDINHIINLLEKSESIDVDTIDVLTVGIRKISGIIAKSVNLESVKTQAN